ncbi:MAG: hypothetical protein V7707_07845 [Motiliproteus sp.]
MNIRTLCAITLVSASMVTFAEEKPDFKAVDADADGYISIEEAKAVPGLAEVFMKSDIDQDGKLSEVEYSEIS